MKDFEFIAEALVDFLECVHGVPRRLISVNSFTDSNEPQAIANARYDGYNYCAYHLNGNFYVQISAVFSGADFYGIISDFA